MKILTFDHYPKMLKSNLDLGYKNLVVCGCSFTSSDFGYYDNYKKTLENCYNNIKDKDWPEFDITKWNLMSDSIRSEVEKNINWKYLTYITWPIYTRDLIGAEKVFDLSLPGGGNTHINDSLIYHIEKNNIPKEKTLIVVMWSGYDRDDIIADKSAIKQYAKSYFNYTDKVGTAITGGIVGASNSIVSLDGVKKIKSNHSRAIENFVRMVGLRAYLQQKQFDFVFTSFTGLSKQKLERPTEVFVDLEQMFDVTTFLGDISDRTIDEFHPAAEEHHKWSQNILVPFLAEKFLNKSHSGEYNV